MGVIAIGLSLGKAGVTKCSCSRTTYPSERLTERRALLLLLRHSAGFEFSGLINHRVVRISDVIGVVLEVLLNFISSRTRSVGLPATDRGRESEQHA